ncbi:MAG: 8-amino-7-oxononanoate synthase [Frankiales bacterium]|nr:8-amino-7-oxononanoate synthase [Frankiales bacterium]
MSSDPRLQWLADSAAERLAAGLHREPRPQPKLSSRSMLDLASNDYLGLSRDERVIEAAAEAAREWGTGSTGSRLVTGTTELHLRLEAALAELVGAPSALVFSSGYLANLGVITALAGPDCLVVSDRGNHASLVDGCRLAKSDVVITPHGDQAAAERALQARREPRALVVIDAINSADGDLLALNEWHQLARRNGALLIVDDAHGVGVRGDGRGSVFEAGIAAEPDVVTTVTLSKSLAAQGGAVLAAGAVIEHLIDTARPFIFDTGLNPPAVGAALAAVQIITAEPELAKTVLQRAAELAATAGVPVTDGAVVPVIIGAAAEAFALAEALRARGIQAGCFRPPSVPVGTARLRLTANARLSAGDIERFGVALADARSDLDRADLDRADQARRRR